MAKKNNKKLSELSYALLFDKIHHFDFIKNKKFDADWIVFKEDNIIYVAFEGTKSFKDVLMDLLFIPVKDKLFNDLSLKFHKGFRDAYWSVRSQVLDECYKLYKEGDSFTLLGHSLGGAMAGIAAEDIAYHFNTKVTLITYGAPYIAANKKTAKNVNSYLTDESIAFENGNDFIPHVPFFFKHINNKKHIGKKYNFFKAFYNLIFQKASEHTSYNNSSIY